MLAVVSAWEGAANVGLTSDAQHKVKARVLARCRRDAVDLEHHTQRPAGPPRARTSVESLCTRDNTELRIGILTRPSAHDHAPHRAHDRTPQSTSTQSSAVTEQQPTCNYTRLRTIDRYRGSSAAASAHCSQSLGQRTALNAHDTCHQLKMTDDYCRLLYPR